VQIARGLNAGKHSWFAGGRRQVTS
jgi:hypothetical protein